MINKISRIYHIIERIKKRKHKIKKKEKNKNYRNKFDTKVEQQIKR